MNAVESFASSFFVFVFDLLIARKLSYCKIEFEAFSRGHVDLDFGLFLQFLLLNKADFFQQNTVQL